MEFRIALEIFLIISYLLYYGNANDVCIGNQKPIAKSGICGENVTLSGEFQQNGCTKGLWAFRGNTVINYFTQEDCLHCEESFSVNDVKNLGLITNLHIRALNENHTGLYDCSCQDQRLVQSIKCFSVSLQTLDIKSGQNGDVTDESSVDRNHQSTGDQNDDTMSNGGSVADNDFNKSGWDRKITPSDGPVTKVTTTNDGTGVTNFTTSSDRYTTFRILDTSTEYIYIVILANVTATLIVIIFCLCCKVYHEKCRNFTENVDRQNPVYERSIIQTKNSKKEFEHDQTFYDGIYYYIDNDNKSTEKS
ncbi:uncharacterized protein [Apostichopus japonicus]|uniref:uncharacterized protein n=1 Tax=Stichopus japonicus TaxID=307972 RepID=UPI003AB53638